MIPTTRRGLSSMRTHISRRMTSARQPHELYMKLTSLEIERSRRLTEKEAIERRLRSLSERLRDIEEEQEQMLRLLDAAGAPLTSVPSLQNRDSNSKQASMRY
jgi:phosphopantetheine adenylyltransferase